MHSEIITSIDIGSHAIKIIVAEYSFGDEQPRILSSTKTESIGIKNGSIFHKKDALLSLSNALKEAEEKSGVKIERIIISIGGISLETLYRTETVYFKEENTTITNADINTLISNIEENTLALYPNNMCIDVIPGNFEYNGISSFIKPIDVSANSLTASTLIMMFKKKELQTILSLFKELKREVLKIIPATEAVRASLLTKKQTSKQLCIVDIGGGTTSIGVYREGNLISYSVYPFGSENLTENISKELGISYEFATRIKHGDHSIHITPIQKKAFTNVSRIFINDILETIEYHIHSIKRETSITLIDTIYIGGGSLLSDFQTAVKKETHLLYTKPYLENLLIHKRKIESIIHAIAFGLILIDINDLHQFGKRPKKITTYIKNFFKKLIELFIP